MTTTFLLIEGFDVYPDVASTSQGVQARWLAAAFDSYDGNLVTGRFGGKAYGPTSDGGGNYRGLAYALYPALSGSSALTIGMALNLQFPTVQFSAFSLSNNGVWGVGTAIIGVGVTNLQQPYIWVGSPTSPVATALLPVSTDSWHYFELTWSGGVSGTATLYVDGVQACTFTGNTGTLTADTLILFTPEHSPTFGTSFYYDDIYVATTATRIGEARVETLNTASNSSVTWTPLANTNWQEVGETICDGDTSYNFTSAADNTDLFGINSLAENPLTIYAVQVRAAIRKTDATTHITHTVISSGGTLVEGADWAVAGTYLYDIDIFVNDPHISAPWTYTTVNAALIGYELIS